MFVTNPEVLIKAFEDVQCGRKYAAQISSKDFALLQYETQPLKGYQAPKNFPLCCNSHKSILKQAVNRFEAFPNCCEHHKKLNTAEWFKKSDYAYMPLKVVTTVAYTLDCVFRCIENPNWYKEITDYIDATIKSFGQLPDGFGSPVGIEIYEVNVEKNIETETQISEFKRKQLVDFIKQYSSSKQLNENKEPVEQIDLNLLISTYKKWLKDFPFQLPFLSHLKPYYENQMPILKGKGETNIYTGLTGFKVLKQSELISFLVTTTENIITEINTLSLYENGLINDIQKTNIDVLNATRKLELNILKEKPNKDRKQYISILKQWLNGEQNYLSKLSVALINVVPKREPTTSKRNKLNAPIIALFCYLVNESGVVLKNENETILTYCKKVCSKYKLQFTDKVRQAFSNSSNARNAIKVCELILPNIDASTSKAIREYLNKKQPLKHNLYA